MMVTTGVEAFAYAVGEEVVVRLDGQGVFNVDEGTALSAGCVPKWTIGAVAARTVSQGARRYALRFRHHGATCLCLVPEALIEGTA